LKELGIIQISVACYVGEELHLFEKSFYNWAEQKGMNAVAAFTVAELAAMIGKGTNAASLLYDAVQARMNQSHSFTICYSPQFLSNCIIGLLETGRLTPAEVNERLNQ
jgi:hypothetical protein